MYTFQINIIKGLLLTVLIGLLTACGGGGGGAQSSQPVVAKGVITNLGSIWVNGVEYETPEGGSYSNDNSTSTTASYEVGQVVSLRGRRNDDGVSGTADEVEYEAEIEGAAAADNVINGVTIVITDNTNVTATLSVSRVLDVGIRYEVSGFWLDENTTIEATFIKEDDDGDDEDEIKGLVKAADTTSITVHGIIYLFDNSSLSFTVGNFVEVHFDPSTFTPTPDTYTATNVELEDDFFDNLGEGQEVEIEGPVSIPSNLSTACPNGGDFLIGDRCIDWDTNTEWSDGLDSEADLLSGIRVEAEGHVNAVDVLVAEEIKGRGNRVRALSIPIDTGAGNFDLFGGAIQVTTSSATELDGIALSTLLAGSGVEVRGIRTGPTSMLATRIDAEDAPVDRNELRAEVDLNGVDSTVSSETVTVMGLTVDVNGSTQLEIEDVLHTGTLTSFLDMIDDNDIVVDGPRDIVDLRFDIGSLIADQIEIELEDD